MLTKGHPQNAHKYFVKKTEKMHDKYSKPTGDRFLFSENTEEGSPRGKEGGGGWEERVPIHNITYCLNH